MKNAHKLQDINPKQKKQIGLPGTFVLRQSDSLLWVSFVRRKKRNKLDQIISLVRAST